MCFKVEVKGVDGELKKIAESKLTIKPNFAYTLSEVRDDIQRVFDAGYFQQITPAAEDTRDGIKLTLQVLDQVGMDGVVYIIHLLAKMPLIYHVLKRSPFAGNR